MEGFVIPTRQKTDVLFQSTTPLPAGVLGAFTSNTARVAGYGQIAILAISDQPFTITVTEAIELPPTLAEPQQALVPTPLPPPLPPSSPPGIPASPTVGVGTFGQTQATIVSALVGANHQVAMRIQPFGTFMKMVLANTGAQETLLNFAAIGIPLS